MTVDFDPVVEMSWMPDFRALCMGHPAKGLAFRLNRSGASGPWRMDRGCWGRVPFSLWRTEWPTLDEAKAACREAFRGI